MGFKVARLSACCYLRLFLLLLAAPQVCVAELSFQAVRHVGVIAVSHRGQMAL